MKLATICAFLLMVAAGSLHSQTSSNAIIWSDPILLCDSADASYEPVITLTGDDTIHIAWDNEYGYRMPYRRSTDGGNTFEPMREMFNYNNTFGFRPTILSYQDNVYLFFVNIVDTISTKPYLWMRRSSDRGATWSDPQQMTPDFVAEVTTGTISNDTLAVIYALRSNGVRKLLTSTDGGTTWTKMNGDYDIYDRIALTGEGLHFVSDIALQYSTEWEILYRRSTDLGSSWDSGTLLSTNDNIMSDIPSLSAFDAPYGMELWSAWRDGKNGYSGLFGASLLSRMKIADENWKNEQLLTDQPSGIISSLASNGKIHGVAWWDEVVPYESTNVIVRETNNSLDSFSAYINITPNQYLGSPPKLATSTHAIHVVYERKNAYHFHVYYRKGEFVQSGALLALSSNVLAFDTTVDGDIRNDTVLVSNPGSDTLFTGTIVSNNGNFSATPPSLVLAPGCHANVVIGFTPNVAGPMQGHIVFYNNGPSSPDYISVTGIGTWRTTSIGYDLGHWNLVSTPFSLGDTTTLPLHYRWDSTYQIATSMAVGSGYWIKPTAPFTYRGAPVRSANVDVQEGWNLIGSTAQPMTLDSISTVPAGNIASDFFGYSRHAYGTVDTLIPGFGYWVKMKQSGILVLSGQKLSPDKKTISGRKN